MTQEELFESYYVESSTSNYSGYDNTCRRDCDDCNDCNDCEDCGNYDDWEERREEEEERWEDCSNYDDYDCSVEYSGDCDPDDINDSDCYYD